jgi:hypothetical protein
VKDVLAELHSGPSGEHLGVNKTLAKVRQRYYWLQARHNVDEWCQHSDTCTANCGPQTRGRVLMHQCNVMVTFERIVIDIAGPFPQKY